MYTIYFIHLIITYSFFFKKYNSQMTRDLVNDLSGMDRISLKFELSVLFFFFVCKPKHHLALKKGKLGERGKVSVLESSIRVEDATVCGSKMVTRSS